MKVSSNDGSYFNKHLLHLSRKFIFPGLDSPKKKVKRVWNSIILLPEECFRWSLIGPAMYLIIQFSWNPCK